MAQFKNEIITDKVYRQGGNWKHPKNSFQKTKGN